MLAITLPDNSIKHFSQAVSVLTVCQSIGAGLTKAAIAAKINTKTVDLSYIIDKDVHFEIITASSDEGLEILRHSCAHLLAQAVKRLFSDTQVTIGPVIENGFYYDFLFTQTISSHHLVQIEQEMKKIIQESLAITRKIVSKSEAISFFKNIGENFKAEIIEQLEDDQNISLYSQGEFTDLCRGVHIINTNKINPNCFTLTKLAGAYWRGDSNNAMLTRIYGTLWTTPKELKQYLFQIEQAEKRDHRKLGPNLSLFHLQEQAQGMVFWHQKGYQLFRLIEDYLRNNFRKWDYQEVKTPQLIDRSLWEKSGHWQKFSQEMFTFHSEIKDLALKPMNCPGHIQIFNQNLHSYRDLPLRIAEFGSCHRNEPSGSLHGLMRLRGFVQDDGHIFCTDNQVMQEAAKFNQELFQVYQDFGFNQILIKLSTRPEKRIGDDNLWDKAEQALADSLNKLDLDWQEQKGEGAFYGPKIEYSLKDSLGRIWQCGTLQLDFFLPQRLEANYIDEHNQKQHPVMLHRAVLGSIERFIGILIENYAGSLPFWIAPQQISIIPVVEKYHSYAKKVNQNLLKWGFRSEVDLRNEKIGYKIRSLSQQKIPYVLVVGEVESKQNTVCVRTLGSQKVENFTLESFVEILNQKIKNKII